MFNPKSQAMMKYLFLIFPFVVQSVLAQQICFYGTVYDRDNKEVLPFASIFLLSGNEVIEGTYANKKGEWILCTDSLLPLSISVTAEGYPEAVYPESRFMPYDSLKMHIPMQKTKKKPSEKANQIGWSEVFLVIDIIDRFAR